MHNSRVLGYSGAAIPSTAESHSWFLVASCTVTVLSSKTGVHSDTSPSLAWNHLDSRDVQCTFVWLCACVGVTECAKFVLGCAQHNSPKCLKL
eukprot:2233506-Rhodomonas_salina.1